MKGFSVSFLLPLVILFLSVIWVGFSAVGKNLLAKDVVFAYTALVAATVMFLLNLLFSLRSMTTETAIYPHIIHTQNGLDVYAERRSFFIVQKRGEISRELNIPDPLNPFDYSELADKSFCRDLNEFLRISIVGSILHDCPDWSARETRFRGQVTRSYIEKRENAGDNSFFDVGEIISDLSLRISKDVLKPFTIEGITLPPNTNLSGGEGRIAIENPFVYITIETDFALSRYRGFFSYNKSGTRQQVIASSNMDNVVSYDASITITSTFKAQRKGSPLMQDYVDWVEGITDYLSKGLSPVSNAVVG